MFCGFPVSVATLPAFAPKASARRYGSGGSSAPSTIASTSGVIIRADRVVHEQRREDAGREGDGPQQRAGPPDRVQDPAARPPEESGLAEVGGQDHGPEE